MWTTTMSHNVSPVIESVAFQINLKVVSFAPLTAVCSTMGGIVGKSVDAYAKQSVTRNVKKYRYQQRYEVLGTEVDGHSGRVGTPLEKLRQICRLVGGFLMKS